MKTLFNKVTSAIAGTVVLLAAGAVAGLGLAVLGMFALFALAVAAIACIAAPFASLAQRSETATTCAEAA